MTEFLWISHSSGGNLAPSLGIAKALSDDGEGVTLLVKPDRLRRVEEEGLKAIPLTRAYEQVENYPDMGPITKVACSITSDAVLDEIVEVIAREQPDVLIVDAMHVSGLKAAAESGLPTAVVCHTFLFRQLDAWQGMFDKLAGMRAHAGFSALPAMEASWKAVDRFIVTSVAALDDAPLPGWDNVVHVGPSLRTESQVRPLDLPWQDDTDPLVTVAFTTTELATTAKIQTTLDALADLPVRVVATLGGFFDASDLRIPTNAYVTPYADHDALLERSALAVTHGGHGTMMRCLKHGVPMVMIPGFPHDQAPNSGYMQARGCAIALEGDADQHSIREAVQTMLADPGYKTSAAKDAEIVNPLDGSQNAASELKALAASRAPAAA